MTQQGSPTEELIYTAEAYVEGGRDGSAKLADGSLEVSLKAPLARGGPGGGVNPEQLFAIGFAACFESSMRAIARRLKLDPSDSSIVSKVFLYSEGPTGFHIGVELDVALPHISDHEAASEVLRATHDRCPYSRATRGNITVTLKANGRVVDHD